MVGARKKRLLKTLCMCGTSLIPLIKWFHGGIWTPLMNELHMQPTCHGMPAVTPTYMLTAIQAVRSIGQLSQGFPERWPVTFSTLCLTDRLLSLPSLKNRIKTKQHRGIRWDQKIDASLLCSVTTRTIHPASWASLNRHNHDSPPLPKGRASNTTKVTMP